MPFHHHHGGDFFHHGRGLHHAFAGSALAKVLVIIAAFAVAVIARYVTIQWVRGNTGNEQTADRAGWLAFVFALVVIVAAGLRFL